MIDYRMSIRKDGRTQLVASGYVSDQGEISLAVPNDVEPGSSIVIEWRPTETTRYESHEADSKCGCPFEGYRHGGPHKSHYGVPLADHRFDAERPDMPCQMILRGIDPANVCGRLRSEHASGVWDDVHHSADYGASSEANPYDGKSLDDLGAIMESSDYRNPQHNGDHGVPASDSGASA